MPRQIRVFLCHASQDKPAVRELYKRLKSEEWIDPWLDEEKLSFGQHWTTTIEEALSEADVVLIFLSKNSVQKEGFVQRELNYAWELSLEKPRNVIFLIPFRLDDCQIPRYLGSRQWGDYFGDKKENTYQILLRSLKQRYQQKLKLEAEEEAERARAGRETTEKLAREKADRESAEKAALERQEEVRKKAELEFIEKAKLKEAKKKAEWETAERISREKVEREEIERAQAKQKEMLEKQKLNPVLKPVPVVAKKVENVRKPAPKLNVGSLGIGGIVIVFACCLIIAAFGGNYLYKNIISSPAPNQVFTSVPQTISPRSGSGSNLGSKKDGMPLVYVDAGEFKMGVEIVEEYSVNLDAFWIDQTEVTNAMYSKCVADGGCKSPSSTSSYTHESYYGNSEFGDYPVIYVDWKQANAYCSWAGRRLPTEAEWEKAARGPDSRTYPWGEEISCVYANYYSGSKNCVGDTTPVGSYPAGASVYGAVDMAGNVWEWVSSLYQDYPYNENDGREDLTASGSRVLRGGSWESNDISSVYRIRLDPSGSSYFLGFRCAMDVIP